MKPGSYSRPIAKWNREPEIDQQRSADVDAGTGGERDDSERLDGP
jgi:hypothetical protein